MTSPIHILGIAGSLRRHSYNKRLLNFVPEVLPPATTFEIYDLAPLPFYNEDVEKAGIPASVQAFQARLAAADALLIATPEYNFSIPGVLKNALDWASRRQVDGSAAAINGKPLAIMGGGGRLGTVRAQLHLREMALHNNMHVLANPQVFVPKVWSVFDDEGRISDEGVRDQIAQLVDALVQWTRRLQQ